MVGYSLTHIDGVVRFGSLYEYVASFGIFNGADVGKTIDNGLYLLIIYFSWFAANTFAHHFKIFLFDDDFFLRLFFFVHINTPKNF